MRTAAATAGTALISVAGCLVRDSLLPPLFDGMDVKHNWRAKLGALQLLEAYAKLHPLEIALRLSEIIPTASDCLSGPQSEVIPFIGEHKPFHASSVPFHVAPCRSNSGSQAWGCKSIMGGL